MKKIIVIIISFGILINEFTLSYILDVNIGNANIRKIRFFNLITFITLLIIFFYYENFKKIKKPKKILILIIYLISLDFFSGYVGYGYSKDEKDELRYIFPYDWIRGEPNKLDHNQFGFRGKSADIKRNNDKFLIGFFGGSTGYEGSPTIIEIISKKMSGINMANDVINFSSISSNHNQHLHRLLEFSEYKYDLIIFYGGGNETIQQYYYDSRPGYPYNFFLYDLKKISFINILIKYSNLIGEINKKFNLYAIFNPKTSNEADYRKWVNKINKNYFKTMEKAKNISEKMLQSNKCNKTQFLGIFQPLKPPNNRTKKLVNTIKSDLNNSKIYDFSYLKKRLIFKDYIHVDQRSKEIIANEILFLIKEKLQNKNIC